MRCFHCGEPNTTVICETHSAVLPAELRDQLQAAADVYWNLRLAATAWIALVDGELPPGEIELNALKRMIR